MDKLTLEEIEAMPKEFLTVNEVCAAMGIGRHSFYRYVYAMQFPVLKIGRVYRIPKQPFVEFLKNGRAE
ncbi:MAG: helix-turn-helix domain-containing protein [Ruminococcus sp.]|nr:helix-turn-helix domain-containing protein [Ruminococcus sp.]MBQ8903178.1 helix-turn-helix domain-containing protein [Oscillospiraceae bacterium]